MLPPYALVMTGALFKKKVKENGHDGTDAKSREKAIRDKVVDDLRSREDTLREREAAIASREREHGKKSAELALKLQELAVRETELKGKYSDGGAPARPAGHHNLPPDFDHPGDQEKLVLALEQRLAGARARHEELRRSGTDRRLQDTIAAYRTSGYVVSRLEKLHDLAAAELEKEITRFESDAAALGPLAARCDAIDRAAGKDAEAIRARCNDPDALADIERGLRELEKRVEARKAELRRRVDRWKGEGYSVARFGKFEDAGLGQLEDAVAKFEEDLEVLCLFAEKLDALDPSARKGAARLVPMLRDPDNIPALEKEFLELDKQAGIRRQEFLELFEKWKSEGFRVEPLEKVLPSELSEIRTEFLKFDEDIRRLRALSERAARLDARFAPRVAGLDRGLHDPEQLRKMEVAVRELEDEAERLEAAADQKPRAPSPPKAVAAPGIPPAPEKPPPPPPPPGPNPPEAAPHGRTRPAPESAPGKAEAPPAQPGDAESEVKAEVAAAESAIKDLEARKVDPSAAANLLKLGKSFIRSKNFAKALQYAKKARDTAESMRK